MFSAAWHHNYCPEAVAQCRFYQAEGEVCAALLLPEASRPQGRGLVMQKDALFLHPA